MKMYKSLAKYYDKIYQDKDYKREVAIINNILKKNKAKTLLEVACGTGRHTEFLAKKYKVTGIDLNKDMLNLAKKRVKGVKFIEGDMKKFKLNQRFDAITCLFSSIAYIRTKKDLEKTFKNFYNHLNDKGILIFDTGFFKESFKDGYKHSVTYIDDNLAIARFGSSKRFGNKAKVSFRYLIRNRGKYDFIKETHTIGLFSINEMKNILEKAGFKVRVQKGFRGEKSGALLFIGVKK